MDGNPPARRRDAASVAAAPAAAAVPWAALLRRVLELAAPTTLLAVIQTACQLVEPWLAARQGTAALAGWAVVLPFALLLQQMSAGAMGGGVVSAVARAVGGGRPAEASALVGHAALIAAGFGLCFALLLGVFPRAVLGFVGGAEAAEAAAAYAAWVFGAGAVPAWLATAPFRQVVSGYDNAARSHGGAGALYIRLKRSRP